MFRSLVPKGKASPPIHLFPNKNGEKQGLFIKNKAVVKMAVSVPALLFLHRAPKAVIWGHAGSNLSSLDRTSGDSLSTAAVFLKGELVIAQGTGNSPLFSLACETIFSWHFLYKKSSLRQIRAMTFFFSSLCPPDLRSILGTCAWEPKPQPPQPLDWNKAVGVGFWL